MSIFRKIFHKVKRRKFVDQFKTSALVVDDEPDIVLILSKSLEWLGVKVEVAAGERACEDAIKMLKENEFDIVFIDLNMPHMGGLELVKYIQYRHYRTIIVVVSGFIEKLSEVKGYVGILNKPFTQSQILEVLQKHRLPHI